MPIVLSSDVARPLLKGGFVIVDGTATIVRQRTHPDFAQIPSVFDSLATRDAVTGTLHMQ